MRFASALSRSRNERKSEVDFASDLNVPRIMPSADLAKRAQIGNAGEHSVRTPMFERIERFQSELHVYALVEFYVLDQRDIPELEPGS